MPAYQSPKYPFCSRCNGSSSNNDKQFDHIMWIYSYTSFYFMIQYFRIEYSVEANA